MCSEELERVYIVHCTIHSRFAEAGNPGGGDGETAVVSGKLRDRDDGLQWKFSFYMINVVQMIIIGVKNAKFPLSAVLWTLLCQCEWRIISFCVIDSGILMPKFNGFLRKVYLT
jgi:hypothetical protein